MRKSMVVAACAAMMVGGCFMNGAASAASVRIPNFSFKGESGFYGNVYKGTGVLASPINSVEVQSANAVLSTSSKEYEFTYSYYLFESFPIPDECLDPNVGCLGYLADNSFYVDIDIFFDKRYLTVSKGLYKVDVLAAERDQGYGLAYFDIDGPFNYNPIVSNSILTDLTFSLAQVPLPSSLPLSAAALVVLGVLGRFKPASARPAKQR